MLQPSVFISYSAKDQETAHALCAALEESGIRCWIAPRDVVPGVAYEEALIDAIAASQVMLLLLSANSVSSEHVTREVRVASNKGIRVVPVRIENVALSKSMEYFLGTVHCIDALTAPLSHHFPRIVETFTHLVPLAPQATAPSDVPPRTAPSVPARESASVGAGPSTAPSTPPSPATPDPTRETASVSTAPSTITVTGAPRASVPGQAAAPGPGPSTIATPAGKLVREVASVTSGGRPRQGQAPLAVAMVILLLLAGLFLVARRAHLFRGRGGPGGMNAGSLAQPSGTPAAPVTRPLGRPGDLIRRLKQPGGVGATVRPPGPLAGNLPPGGAFIQELGGGVKLELVKIPAGGFLMGSPPSEEGRYEDEGPPHPVKLRSFWMGKYEVTQAQWQAVMGNLPSHFKAPDRPVEQVSWNDAKEFCLRLDSLTGKSYTLPSEAQWEYACRAGTQTAYFFGSAVNQLGGHAWLDSNSDGQTHPVGQKSPNPWGLYDMYGNVWEWCEDIYHKSYKGAPRDGSAWAGGPTEFRVARGGSWRLSAWDCRSANRGRTHPRTRGSANGFRVVLPDLTEH